MIIGLKFITNGVIGMDTMQLELIFDERVNWTKREENNLIAELTRLKGRGNRYTYVDVLYSRSDYKVIVKLSYPRYFFGNNAYLVKSAEECKEVQRAFVGELRDRNRFKGLKAIKVTRIDIPFTFLMLDNREFSDYSNIYKIMGEVFINKFTKTRPKAISDLITSKKETIIFTDSAVSSAYNKKVIIYNQYLNLKGKLDDHSEAITSREFTRTEKTFPDLRKRMRIEFSTRVRRKAFTLNEFKREDLFKHYSKVAKNFLLEKLLDERTIEDVYNVQIDKLIKRLKNIDTKINYENFILTEFKDIYSYEVLRTALSETIKNDNTFKNAITRVRRVLKQEEEEYDGIIILDVTREIKEIRKLIKTYFKKSRETTNNSYPF